MRVSLHLWAYLEVLGNMMCGVNSGQEKMMESFESARYAGGGGYGVTGPEEVPYCSTVLVSDRSRTRTHVTTSPSNVEVERLSIVIEFGRFYFHRLERRSVMGAPGGITSI